MTLKRSRTVKCCSPNRFRKRIYRHTTRRYVDFLKSGSGPVRRKSPPCQYRNMLSLIFTGVSRNRHAFISYDVVGLFVRFRIESFEFPIGERFRTDTINQPLSGQLVQIFFQATLGECDVFHEPHISVEGGWWERKTMFCQELQQNQLTLSFSHILRVARCGKRTRALFNMAMFTAIRRYSLHTFAIRRNLLVIGAYQSETCHYHVGTGDKISRRPVHSGRRGGHRPSMKDNALTETACGTACQPSSGAEVAAC